MNCIHCGAELRAGARFCNVCGAQQRRVGDDASATSAEDTDSGVGQSADTLATRLKRPPRVPRTSTDLAAEADVSPLFSAAPIADAADTRETGSAPAWEARADGLAPNSDVASAPADQALPPADLEDAEATGYAMVRGPSADAAKEDAAPPPAWDPDGFSWPLPLQIIKGGRYRVEALLQAAADPTTGENVYRVRDLQGYERCWSCGAEYGAEHATDTFCRQCGADLFGRPYRMYERRLPPQEVRGDAAPPDQAEPAETASDDISAASEAPVASPDEHRFVEGHRAYRVVPDVPEPSPFPNGPRLLVGAAADVGKTRPGEQNEDSLGVFALSLGVDSHMYPIALAIVADGLGGHASGQEASRLVVRTLADYVLRQVALPFLASAVTGDEAEEQVTGLLRDAAGAANVALCNANDTTGADSGSTLVAALVLGGTAYLANVGDSRAYALAEGELRRLTTDHSLVEQLIAGGIITPEERYIHPHRNQIFKSLGDDPALQPDTFVQGLRPGMRLLLCSDGVWEMVRDDELARLLADSPDPQQAAEALVARANENGGEDNISAIVLEVRA